MNQGDAQAHEQKLKEMSLLPGLTLDVLQIILPGTIDLKGGECSEHLRLSLIDICLEIIPAALHRKLITSAQRMLERTPQGGASWDTSKNKLLSVQAHWWCTHCLKVKLSNGTFMRSPCLSSPT